MRRIASCILLATLTMSIFAFSFNIHSVKATGTIYIRADGSIDPPTAPISTVDNITFILTDKITTDADGIVIERNNAIVDGSGCKLQGSGLWGSKGVDLEGSINVTITNMQITGFTYAIFLRYSSCASLERNNITNNLDGIYVESSPSNDISCNNIANNNEYGINLYYSNFNSILKNTIANNKIGGIHLFFSPNNSIFENSIANNEKWGVSMWSSNESIFGNNITNSIDGIHLTDSSNNIISTNRIADNERGIGIYWVNLNAPSSNNVIYHNNFANNFAQVYSESLHVNLWDDGYPSGGNYWSDYTGVDENSDGLGDSPYVIDANNQDNCPLMKPYAGPHDIGIISLSVSKTVIAQGVSALTIRFEVINYGIDAETFNVAAYANQSSIFGLIISPVPGRDSVVFVFAWHTTAFATGNYTITVYAGQVFGETDLSDNMRNITVQVTLAGDITGDFFVNIKDAALISVNWQQNSPPAPANTDINDDGVINIKDAALIALNWQQHA